MLTRGARGAGAPAEPGWSPFHCDAAKTVFGNAVTGGIGCGRTPCPSDCPLAKMPSYNVIPTHTELPTGPGRHWQTGSVVIDATRGHARRPRGRLDRVRRGRPPPPEAVIPQRTCAQGLFMKIISHL